MSRYNKFELTLARMFKIGRPTELKRVLNNIYDLVQSEVEEDLFNTGSLDKTPRTLAQAVKEVLGIDYDGQANSRLVGVDTPTGERGQRERAGDAGRGEREEGEGRSPERGGEPERTAEAPVENEQASSSEGDIRFAIGKKRKDDMRKGLLNKLTNATEEQVERTITEIEKLGERSKAGGDAKVEKAALHWARKGTIILPEDGYKVIAAVKMATDKGIDITQYDSPMRLINENTSWKKRKDMADPDKVATLNGKRALGNTGITIYNVEDSEQGQRDMRMLWNGTWGEERECPWCLLHDDGHGGVSAHAKRYWSEIYTAYPKRVTFKDGRPIAFFAEEKGKEPHWWDLNDQPHEGIPVEGKIPDDELGRDARMLYNMDGSIKDYEFISRGNEENGIYETWWSLDTKRSEGFYENGAPRVYKEWDEKGTLREYDDGLRQYSWDKEGTLLSAYIPERGSAKWHKNGVPASASVSWSKIRGQIFPITTSGCEWTSDGRLMSSTRDGSELILGDNEKQIKREDGLKVSLDDNNHIVSVIKEGSSVYRELIPGRYYQDADGHRYYYDENGWKNSYSYDYCSEERQSEIERECSEFLGEAEAALPELAAIEERLRVDARMKEVQWADREEVEKEARRSLKSYHIGNSDSMHSTSRATSPVDTGDQSADETSGAKVDKKIKNGKDFLKSIAAFSVEVQRGEVAGKDFVRAFMQYLGYNDHGQSSEYIHFSADNERITLRMSDHRGNAQNIIINGVRTDKGYSIVISSEDARDGIKFKNSSWAQVDEYVYKDPSQKQLVDITRGLFNLFDEGEYLDLAGAAEHNVSPKAEKDGQKKDDTLFRTDPSAATVEGKTATRVNSATVKETAAKLQDKFGVENPETNKQNSDDNTRFNISSSPRRGRTADVHSVAAELQDKFGVEAEVVESLDGVQNEQARKALPAGKVVKGWYEPSTG